MDARDRLIEIMKESKEYRSAELLEIEVEKLLDGTKSLTCQRIEKDGALTRLNVFIEHLADAILEEFVDKEDYDKVATAVQKNYEFARDNLIPIKDAPNAVLEQGYFIVGKEGIEHRCKTILRGIKQRCENPNCKEYNWYGKKGIKCRIKLSELVDLWVQDEAYKLKQPSIDRINPKDHYSYLNCRFIELSENCGRAHKGKKRPHAYENFGDNIGEGRTPWNKGHKETRPEVLQRQSDAHKGKKYKPRKLKPEYKEKP